MLWWFDLSCGILGYDTSLTEPSLRFHELPDARNLKEEQPHIHTKRCVMASSNKLRYVEIIPEGEAATTVSTWSWRWSRVPGE